MDFEVSFIPWLRDSDMSLWGFYTRIPLIALGICRYFAIRLCSVVVGMEEADEEVEVRCGSTDSNGPIYIDLKTASTSDDNACAK